MAYFSDHVHSFSSSGSKRVRVVGGGDVAAGARVAVPVPGAADVVAGLEHGGRQAQPAQPLEHVQPGDPGADDDDVELWLFGHQHPFDRAAVAPPRPSHLRAPARWDANRSDGRTVLPCRLQFHAKKSTMHETQRLSFDGAVDADGHILEPPDLWETYLEPAVPRPGAAHRARRGRPRGARDRRRALEDEPPRLPVDARRDGRPRPARDAARPGAHLPARGAFGSMDPDERLKVLDAEGIDAAVLYTTVGLLWEAELEDAGARRPTPGRTTAGSASSARASRASCRPRTCR